MFYLEQLSKLKNNYLNIRITTFNDIEYVSSF